MPEHVIDYDKLGESVARHLHASCPLGWTVEDAETLREFAKSLRAAKAQALAVVIKVLLLGFIGSMATGFLLWARHGVK